MKIHEALEELGPIRVFDRGEQVYDWATGKNLRYVLDGKPATKTQVIRAAEERQNKRRDIGET